MGCAFEQYYKCGKKERAIYYLSKKFTDCGTDIQWYITLHGFDNFYGLQNDFDNTCYIILHGRFQNWIILDISLKNLIYQVE